MINIEPTVELNREFEGFSSKPYLDAIGIPTIGYGSTYYPGGRKVTMSDPPITMEQARLLMIAKLEQNFLPSVIRLCPILFAKAVMENDINKICAVLSFVYNCGAGNLQISTLRRKINLLEWDEAADEFKKWNKAGGKVLRGLTRRREAEKRLFIKPN